MREVHWATVAEAEQEAGVSRSAIRAWYRSGEVDSVMVGGPHGGQRLVDLDAVVARAAQAGRRIGRRRSSEVIELLLDRIDELERRVEALERGTQTGAVDLGYGDHSVDELVYGDVG